MQETLDFESYAHRDADPTEIEGARFAGEHYSEKRFLILKALYEAGPSGLTDYQLEGKTDILTSSVTSCRNSLKSDHLVEDAPFTRPGRVGTPVRVRRITDLGREVYRRWMA